MWVRKNWLAALEVTKNLKLHPTPGSWHLLSCRRKSWGEYALILPSGGRHLGSFLRIHPWRQATYPGQQCDSCASKMVEEEEKDCSGFLVGRSRSICVVCAQAHSKPGVAHGATSCSQGRLLWDIFPASTTTQCSIRS